MKSIQLRQRWQLGRQIGKGGFGRVFEATGEDGYLAAAKFIPKEPGADRELLFENLNGVRNVVPIVDSGEYKKHWVLIMPRAEKSLREHLINQKVCSPEEAVAILVNIGTALLDVKGSIVHRDIKPENVLFHKERWCLSDFGIARYAEASTVLDTHKWAWTPAYNPPERWRGERATPASDIYSLGIMAFEILRGCHPYMGPDFREEHLTKEAPLLSGCPTPLASLVAECLFKAPQARPTAANLSARLEVIHLPSSPAISLLQAANQVEVQRLSSSAARESQAHSEADRRQELFISACQAMTMIANHLRESILTNASAAIVESKSAAAGFSIRLGKASLILNPPKQSEVRWKQYYPAFEVIAHASLEIKIPADRNGYEGRSHALWFCDAQEEGHFCWYETAFMITPLFQNIMRQTPFTLTPSEGTARSLGRSITQFQVAWPFTKVEPGSEADFTERWIRWFAMATQEKLVYPSTMPERRPDGSWRQ